MFKPYVVVLAICAAVGVTTLVPAPPADAFSSFKGRFSQQCHRIEITGTQQDLNLSERIRQDLGVPASAPFTFNRDVCVEIASGAVLKSSRPERPALSYGPDLAANAKVWIDNEGAILGSGGRGGTHGRGGGPRVANGGLCPQDCTTITTTCGQGKDRYPCTQTVCTPLPCEPAYRPSKRASGQDGGDGGPAIHASRPTRLKNEGLIAGGGGGGGGGAGGTCYECYDDFGASGAGGGPYGPGGELRSDTNGGDTWWRWAVTGGTLSKELGGGRPMNSATYCYLGDPGRQTGGGRGGTPCAHDVSSEWGSGKDGGDGGGPGEPGRKGGGNFTNGCSTYNYCTQQGKDGPTTCTRMWTCIPEAVGGDGGSPGRAIQGTGNLVDVRNRGTIIPPID